jgi:hypothetical protein
MKSRATFADLLSLRNKLWCEVRELPGVVTIGIGSKNNRAALVVFVEEEKLQKANLPVQYEDVPVVVKAAGQAKAHGE